MENQVKKPKTNPNALIGKFFHSIGADGFIEWQGRIVATPEPGWYLIQTFSWLDGSSTELHIKQLSDMREWLFYEDPEDMRYSYEYGAAFYKLSPASQEALREIKREEREDRRWEAKKRS